MTNDPEPDDVTKNMITRMTPTDVMVATGEEKNNGGSTKKGSRLADSPNVARPCQITTASCRASLCRRILQRSSLSKRLPDVDLYCGPHRHSIT